MVILTYIYNDHKSKRVSVEVVNIIKLEIAISKFLYGIVCIKNKIIITSITIE